MTTLSGFVPFMSRPGAKLPQLGALSKLITQAVTRAATNRSLRSQRPLGKACAQLRNLSRSFCGAHPCLRSWRGTLAQYVGRLHREHHAKREVIVYDYVDSGVAMLARMALKRQTGYRSLGYEIGSG
ncbi:MAG: hypothetical protein SFW09_21710 [Hyphomicrobiaceae bacterium]|nr:hypothetical protein [Hyphomicrobiaceae bacterium]